MRRPCAARQSRPVCDDPGVMPRRAGTKGLRGNGVALATEDPVERRDVGALARRRFAWLAAMRLEVAARESGFLWRRTDDRRYSCVCGTGMRREKVRGGGHYELGVCTDETSADYAQRARFRERWPAPRRARPSYGRLARRCRRRSSASKDFRKERHSWGWPQPNPTPLMD